MYAVSKFQLHRQILIVVKCVFEIVTNLLNNVESSISLKNGLLIQNKITNSEEVKS